MGKRAKKVSFIIPMINEYPAVYLTVNNIQTEMSDSRYNWEIIVAENGTQNINTPKGFTGEKALYRVPMKQGLIKYVFEPTQGGPQARNAGAKIADGDYLMFMDAHTSLGKNTIDIMVDHLKSHPECGCLMGMTMKSHYNRNHGGAFYELFHQEKEQERKGGPTLATHMHGTYRALRGVPLDERYDPFKVMMSTQAYVMYRRKEFWDLGGYFSGTRFYPHPEGDLPLKVWMSGKECHTHPDSWHIHGEPCRGYFQTGPERRKKIREYGGYSTGEHGWMNVMKIAYILGKEKWIDICRDALTFKHSIPEYKMEELYKVSLDVATPERERLEGKFKYSLDEILIKGRKARIPGLVDNYNTKGELTSIGWDTRVGEDPLA